MRYKRFKKLFFPSRGILCSRINSAPWSPRFNWKLLRAAGYIYAINNSRDVLSQLCRAGGIIQFGHNSRIHRYRVGLLIVRSKAFRDTANLTRARLFTVINRDLLACRLFDSPVVNAHSAFAAGYRRTINSLVSQHDASWQCEWISSIVRAAYRENLRGLSLMREALVRRSRRSPDIHPRSLTPRNDVANAARSINSRTYSWKKKR